LILALSNDDFPRVSQFLLLKKILTHKNIFSRRAPKIFWLNFDDLIKLIWGVDLQSLHPFKNITHQDVGTSLEIFHLVVVAPVVSQANIVR